MLGADQVDEILEGVSIQKNEILELPLNTILPNKLQPREAFDELALQGLAASIKKNGIIQPIVVQRNGNKYEIIAGERRFRAAQIANLDSIPAIVRDVSELENISFALIENIQREGLNPIEEAKAYKLLLTRFELKQQELADRVGKDRATIANTMRLLDLSANIQDALINREISSGHARALLSLKDEKSRNKVFNDVVEQKMSVRQLENAIKNENDFLKALDQKQTKKSSKKSDKKNKDAQIKMLEEELREVMGTKIHIDYNNGKGKIEIFFYDLDDFERIKDILIS